MRFGSILALALMASAASAEPLENTRAFDRAFAASFYVFDACGDGKYGLIFRRALAARFAQCPFTPQARATHQRRIALQAKRSREMMNALIEKTGGAPNRLPGMDETCRQRQAAADYRSVRERLEKYTEGALTAQDVIPAACDADAITP
jgi:hypothetical protein